MPGNEEEAAGLLDAYLDAPARAGGGAGAGRRRVTPALHGKPQRALRRPH